MYYFTSLNGKGHGIHSPFVYSFVRNVLLDNRQFYAYKLLGKTTDSKYKKLLFKCLHFYQPKSVFFDELCTIEDIIFYMQALSSNAKYYLFSAQKEQLPSSVKSNYIIEVVTSLENVSIENAFLVLHEKNYRCLNENSIKALQNCFIFIFLENPLANYKATFTSSKNLHSTSIHLCKVHFISYRNEQMFNQQFTVFY